MTAKEFAEILMEHPDLEVRCNTRMGCGIILPVYPEVETVISGNYSKKVWEIKYDD